MSLCSCSSLACQKPSLHCRCMQPAGGIQLHVLLPPSPYILLIALSQRRVLIALQMATLPQLEGALARASNASGGPAGNSRDHSATNLAATVVPLVNKLYKLRLEAMLKVRPAAGSVIGVGLPPHPVLFSSPSSSPPVLPPHPLPLPPHPLPHPPGHKGHSWPLPLLRLPVQPS